MINKTDKGKCESFVTVWCSPIFFFKGLMQIIARTKWLWNITECQKQQTTVGDKITRRQKSARYRPADRAASAPGETRREGGGGRRWVGVYGQRQRALE